MKQRRYNWVFFILLFSFLHCAIGDVERRFNESMAMTPPPSLGGLPASFSFIQLTDTHVAGGANRHLSAFVNKVIPSDAFIIGSGDLTENGLSENYAAYRNILSITGLTVYSAIGNHDLWNNGWEQYKKVLGPSVYAVTVSSISAGSTVRIIVLDSGDDTIGAGQYKWLEKQLQAKTEPLCVVVSHYNFFSPNLFETSVSTNNEEVYGMMRMFEKYHVNYVIMGHTHVYDDRTINGVRYLVGDALKVYKSTAEQKYFNRFYVTSGAITHQHVPIY